MAQRYEKLFSLSHRMYCPGAPLIVCAGQLLRDNYSKKLLAQIKYQSITSEPISSLSVSISLFDSAERLLQEPIRHKYTELNTQRDSFFGQKSAIVLPDVDICSFTVSVDEVVFSNGSCWSIGDTPWTELKEQKSLCDSFQDEELAAQYQIRYGSDCKYEPFDSMGLWFCTCGAVNSMEERSCHKCRRVYTALRDINISSMKKECLQRLENEEEQKSEDAEISRIKRKNFRSLALALIPFIAVVILICVFVPGQLKLQKGYESAQSLVSSGDYDAAESAFKALGDYRDSAEQIIRNIPYEETLELLKYAKAGDSEGLELIGVSLSSLSEEDNVSVILYEACAERFDALGDYRDSIQLRDECLEAIDKINYEKLKAQYDAALLLLDDKKFSLAKDAFLALDDFEDSSQMAQEAIYQKAVMLFDFMSQNNIRNAYARISTDAAEPGVISFSKDFALKNGEGYITDFKSACGNDSVDFILEDQPSEGLLPFKEAISQLFASLSDYKDSADYIPRIEELCDYTREFYALVDEGNVYAAYDWLSAYEYEFENREDWLRILEMYKPYCGYWVLNSGDSSLIPYIAGVSRNGTNVCTSFNSSVLIKDDSAILKISNAGDEDFSIELRTDLGNTAGFYNNDNPPFNYFVNISVLNRLAIMKYSPEGKILSSCDYSISG